MRVLLLAGLISAATAPFAAAAENDIADVIDCQVTDTRRAPAEQRLDQAPLSPAATAPRPTIAQREPVEAPRPVAGDRRRNGKPVPDAQLIQPRGTL
jgi:hypothetical protein